ncbi:Phospholipid N-methyltransferase [Sphingomonas guangdongensis]|uniref:Phospholipid N-methyltransferase n=1 Tax=Sphingomonas guangdongensis TaxID=1141890 RepID=A0A285R4U9_9SPHN|nr:methyltransferase domain-containing protein [Sphingomonas guangdongensis]SOB87372.1 Phospholipid N-methyltransferase [Sphingomonas guangdongensis]
MTSGPTSLSTSPGIDRVAALSRRVVRDIGDTTVFFVRWLRDPLGVASIAPSSRALAALITQEIDCGTGPVLELGSGTGAFVPALLARGVAERDLTLIERDRALARRLAGRYPAARVRALDATVLREAMADARFGAAVCGLGLRAMPPADVEAILRNAFALLEPDACLYLFTYGQTCSVPADVLLRLRLGAERVGTTYRNLPPASVFRVRRLPDPSPAGDRPQ